MKLDKLEEHMMRLEPYRALRIPRNHWVVIRVDGRGFARLTNRMFQKPYDDHFRAMMVRAAHALLEETQGVYGYMFSDEVSVLLPREGDWCAGGVEDMLSASAGIASAAFTAACGEPASFSARLWLGPTRLSVINYFRWRLAEAQRDALNAMALHALGSAGHSARAAALEIERKTTEEKMAVLHQHGIALNGIPSWQRRGVGFQWYTVENDATPVPGAGTKRRLKEIPALPTGDEYHQFLESLIGTPDDAPIQHTVNETPSPAG